MLTTEEQRALNFNLSRKRQEQACKVRDIYLRGNDAAKKGLTDRTQAITREESYEQQAKIRYDDREAECETVAIN